eukprot:TRINITY_DN5634_c0_g1_i2.p1 TRINITY_DN5634_c0_g1~~TRINITY_DN5634_c0_g1_i2.p1  ORF type:complete len:326 (+),score=69.55 TRINITY_DN5634_c0_g1_i2:240-1217(+)
MPRMARGKVRRREASSVWKHRVLAVACAGVLVYALQLLASSSPDGTVIGLLSSTFSSPTPPTPRPPVTKKPIPEVASLEYELANNTLVMNQEWWHATEDSAGRTHAGISYWEHALAPAQLLSRHPNPWQATRKLKLLAGEWEWSQLRLLVVMGAELGLLTTTGALIGASVLTLDPSIRLLEVAKRNLEANLHVPEGQGVVALRKARWGSSIELGKLTEGQFRSADVIVLNHASCESILLTGMIQSASSVISIDTLVLVSFQGVEVCEELQALSRYFVLETLQLGQSIEQDVTVVAMKLKPSDQEEQQARPFGDAGGSTKHTPAQG